MPEGPSAYVEALTEARRTAYTVAGNAEREIIGTLEAALQRLASDSSSARITPDRATELKRQTAALLNGFEQRFASSTQGALDATMQTVHEVHEKALAALSAGELTGASYEAMRPRVLAVLASIRRADTFQSLLRYRLNGALSEIDDILRGAISTGVASGRASLDIARTIAGNNPQMLQALENLPDTFGGTLTTARLGSKDFARYGIDPADTRELRTLLFNSRMIARSETMNTLREANNMQLTESPVVEGVIWQLSGSHPVEDECDELARANAYNLGPGVYPPDQWPIAPHPHCQCYQAGVKTRPPSQWGQPRRSTQQNTLRVARMSTAAQRAVQQGRKASPLRTGPGGAIGGATAVPTTGYTGPILATGDDVNALLGKDVTKWSEDRIQAELSVVRAKVGQSAGYAWRSAQRKLEEGLARVRLADVEVPFDPAKPSAITTQRLKALDPDQLQRMIYALDDQATAVRRGAGTGTLAEVKRINRARARAAEVQQYKDRLAAGMGAIDDEVVVTRPGPNVQRTTLTPQKRNSGGRTGGEIVDRVSDEVEEGLGTIPVEIIDGLEQRGLGVRVGHSTLDWRPDLKGQRPRGWAAGTTHDDSIAFFSPSSGEITFGAKNNRIGAAVGTIRHEVGHAVDSMFTGRGLRGTDLSASSRFAKAYREDVKALSPVHKKAHSYYLDESQGGAQRALADAREEAFAESFATVFGGRGRTGPALARTMQFKEAFPRCVEAMEGIVDELVEVLRGTAGA